MPRSICPLVRSLSLIMLLAAACGSPVHQNASHPGHIDSILTVAHVERADSANYLRLIDSAYSSIAFPGASDLWDKYLAQWQYYYFHQRNYSIALHYADTMLELSSSLPGDVEKNTVYARSLLLRGDVLLKLNRYNEAFVSYYHARQVIFKTDDSCIASEFSTRLANVSFRQQKYLQAVGYFKSVLAEDSVCSNLGTFEKFSYQQGNLDNIGICFSRLGMADSANKYFAAALQYISRNATNFPMRKNFIAIATAVVKGNMADVEIDRDNDSAAERLLHESITINSLPQNAPEDAVLSRIKLFRIYLKQQRISEASHILKDCSVAMDTIHNPDIIATLYQLQSQYDSSINDNAGAFANLAKYMHLRDSLASLAAPTYAADLNSEFNEMDEQNRLLLLQQRSHTQTIYITLMAIGVVMGVAIILLIWRNSVQSKANIKALTKTLESLEKSQQDNSRLMKVVAHDLRDPVGAMTSLATLMLEENKGDSELKKMLSLMQATGTNVSGMIDDLLQLHPSGNPAEFEHVDIQELLHYCISLLQHKASEKKQMLSLQSMHAIVDGDREKLWRVFSNLISNAIKFSHEGSVIKVSLQVNDDKALIAVEDKGIGIPSSLQDKIFEISSAAKRKGTAGEPSYGLGLLITRQIVELHKGKIWFTSTMGKGTTFYVELLLVQA